MKLNKNQTSAVIIFAVALILFLAEQEVPGFMGLIVGGFILIGDALSS